MDKKIEVNRKIILKYVDPDGTAREYDTRIKYISPDSIEILAPIEVSDINSLVDQEVTIDEETIGKAPVSHNAVVEGPGEEVLETTGERLIVLKRPVTLQIREFVRVDVNFPLTVNILTPETSEIEESGEEVSLRASSPLAGGSERGHNIYEALAVNLSASGILFVLGLDEKTIIKPGQDVVLNFKLQDREKKKVIKFENISAKIARVYKLEIGDLRRKYTVAVTFSNLTTEQQDQIIHYVLERQIDLQEKELLEISASPIYEQLAILKDEVKRIQEQLRMAHEQIKLAEEARQRSDNIIVQLTKRLSAMREVPRRKYKWWRFWEWFK